MHIVRNTDQDRFELREKGEQIGMLTYRYDKDATVLTHLEVEEDYSGHGLAADLTRAALDHLRQHQETVVPECPYVRGYIIQHPQYQDLLPAAS